MRDNFMKKKDFFPVYLFNQRIYINYKKLNESFGTDMISLQYILRNPVKGSN